MKPEVERGGRRGGGKFHDFEWLDMGIDYCVKGMDGVQGRKALSQCTGFLLSLLS